MNSMKTKIIKSVDLTPGNMTKYDLIMISTDNLFYVWGVILKNSIFIVDIRNAFTKFKNKKF
jgi:hypothetical protein